jgi:glycosyltransferase involved in cell wall biosynthesis
MLSIITPTYNSNRFIESCIQGVIHQNCPDIEHIIVDGGSTDGTVDIIQQYAQQYPHIRWVSEKDRGQSDAMNKGIAMARGEILGFLNVDDFYEPNALNRVLKHFETLPEPSFLVGDCNLWDDDDRLLYVNQPSQISLLMILFDIAQFPFNPSAYFYHASLHDKIGVYDTDDHYAMDLDFVLRAVQIATVKYVNETLGNFRLITGTKTSDMIKSGEIDDLVAQVFTKYRRRLLIGDRLRLFAMMRRRNVYNLYNICKENLLLREKA